LKQNTQPRPSTHHHHHHRSLPPTIHPGQPSPPQSFTPSTGTMPGRPVTQLTVMHLGVRCGWPPSSASSSSSSSPSSSEVLCLSSLLLGNCVWLIFCIRQPQDLRRQRERESQDRRVSPVKSEVISPRLVESPHWLQMVHRLCG